MSIKPIAIKWVFVCDRCKNEFEFFHGMTTWKLDYLNNDSSDSRSFCSELCVRDVYLSEKVGA